MHTPTRTQIQNKTDKIPDGEQSGSGKVKQATTTTNRGQRIDNAVTPMCQLRNDLKEKYTFIIVYAFVTHAKIRCSLFLGDRQAN